MRVVQVLNLLGVLALAVLCSMQWKENRQLNLQINSLEITRIQQEAKINDQAATIKADAADLDELRTRLTIAEATVKSDLLTISSLKHDLAMSQLDRRQLAGERDALKDALDKWRSAVAARDAALKDADQHLRQLIDDRNAAVLKFNDLAEKYNTLVKKLDAERAAPSSQNASATEAHPK